MLYGIVSGLHASAMCAALLVLVANELLLVWARRGQQGPARIAIFANRFAGVLISAGILAGIVVVFLGGWSLLTPWLVASLVLVGLLVALERKLVRPWSMQAQPMLRGAISATEVKAFAGNKRALVGRIGMIMLFALIVVLMVTKPELNPFV
ncbi:DUF2269 family protein [Mesorhizobium sp. B2-5-9]|uniref:DUF2269 family protein n=1 Tax=Mesorhizobium sp. B2-5-9 TaxID=2589921 RepID=UPI00112C10E1|nr:DUF2269 family protein [Mesorhizobium sp. B2-5-9]TPJ99482.1 DUF2269 family protein [Mesorhizobium sp. B2-5-9]